MPPDLKQRPGLHYTETRTTSSVDEVGDTDAPFSEIQGGLGLILWSPYLPSQGFFNLGDPHTRRGHSRTAFEEQIQIFTK